MKATFDLPDELLLAAKRKAATEQTTLRAIVERALRRELGGWRRPRTRPPHRPIHWVTVKGGLPEGLDVADRAAMHDRLRQRRAPTGSRGRLRPEGSR